MKPKIIFHFTFELKIGLLKIGQKVDRFFDSPLSRQKKLFEWPRQYFFDPTSHLRWTNRHRWRPKMLLLFEIAKIILKKNKNLLKFNKMSVYRNVVHHFVVTAWNIDFLDCSWVQFIHEFAQQNSIAERIFEGFLAETFTGNDFNPFLCFLLLLLVTLSSDLWKMNNCSDQRFN